MKLPNKITSYNDSSISKFPMILRTLQEQERTPIELYATVKGNGMPIDEFVEVLDGLYALGAIDLNEEGRLYYVARN